MPSLRVAMQIVLATKASMPTVEMAQPYLWLPGAEIPIYNYTTTLFILMKIFKLGEQVNKIFFSQLLKLIHFQHFSNYRFPSSGTELWELIFLLLVRYCGKDQKDKHLFRIEMRGHQPSCVWDSLLAMPSGEQKKNQVPEFSNM